MAARTVTARRGGGAQLRKAREGWTKARRARFLEVLAETINVTAAVGSVGLSAQGVYRLRKRDAGFAADWDQTIAEAYARVEMLLLERALLGKGSGAAVAAGSEVLEKLSERALLALLHQHRQTVRDVRIATERSLGRRLSEEEQEARAKLVEKLDTIVARLQPADGA